MKWVWSDAGDDPSWGVLAKHQIDGVFMPMLDSLTTKEFLRDEVKARGLVAGIYLGHNWLPGYSPAQLAKAVSDEYQRCYVPGLKVQFNLEQHDTAYIASTLEAWRDLRPTVGTSWSSEGMQGGWMGGDMSKGHPQSSFVTRLLKCKVRIAPQLFMGNMSPHNEDSVMWDLACRGFPASILSPFYDAAAYPADADGFFFTAGRLAP